MVWEVLKEALDRQVKTTGRRSLDVLDSGGGSGNFAVPVARLGHRVTVVDPSPNALFALERRAAEAGVADLVTGVQGDALGLFDVVDRGAYDAVLLHGVLEHMDDPAEGSPASPPPCAPRAPSACSPPDSAGPSSPVHW